MKKVLYAGVVAGLCFLFAGSIWADSLTVDATSELVVKPEKPEKIIPAVNKIKPGAKTGKRPYEMVWADRKEKRKALVDFENLDGWTVECYSGAEACLSRSREQQMWGKHVGKVTFSGNSSESRFVIKPPEPLLIGRDKDCMNLWVYGNNWQWQPKDPDNPRVRLVARFQDEHRMPYNILLSHVKYKYWFLVHKWIGSTPHFFTGLEVIGCSNKKKKSNLFFDSIAFYKEILKPLSFEPWPDKLPFPTREETILPLNKTKRFSNSVRHTGTETVFVYEGDDCELRYRYRPVTGTLSDIVVLYQGRELSPCKGGGVQIAGLGPDSGGVTSEMTGQTFDGNSLTVKWRYAVKNVSVGVTYRFRIRQKTLIVEMTEDGAADGGRIKQVLLGHAEPVTDPKLFWIPYLTFGSKNADPRVLYADGLFYFTQFDWYYSDASALFAKHWARGTKAGYNGGARYTPKTDGRRNRMRERLFINISPDFHEVLPTIPNPPSPMKSVQGDRLWCPVIRGFTLNYEDEVREARHLRALGLEKVTVRYHEFTWDDDGESFTFRLEAAPKRGGDEALRKFVTAVKACGWRVGLYTNYIDYAPVNKYWNEDWVSRAPNGKWMPAWMRCYAHKPMIAVQMQAKLAPQIQKKFGTNHSYCDVHTAVTPFSRVDYDARVPGAGTFRRTFECFGRLLYNEKFAHKGPVYSEGGIHWWYAGLTDGNYAQLRSSGPPREPLLVDFDLLKMHPLQMDAGMGSPCMFYRGSRLRSRSYQQFIATTLAYGHIGFLGSRCDPGASEPDMMKIYYMLQPLQEHYSMVPVRRIAYGRGGKLLNTSDALVTGAYKDSRVYVEYENGLKVWVNGSTSAWVLDGLGPQLVLPQWGYYATTRDGETFSYSGIAAAFGTGESTSLQRHIDLSHGPCSHYLNTRGAFVFADTLAGKGAAALKKESRGWELIPARQFTAFGFSPELIDLGDRDLQVQALNEDGSAGAPATVRWSRSKCYVIPGQGKVFKFRLSPGPGVAPAKVKCPCHLAVCGETVEAILPSDTDVEPTAVRWLVGESEMSADAKVDGARLRVKVPAKVQAGAHAWLSIPTKTGQLWLDFVVD